MSQAKTTFGTVGPLFAGQQEGAYRAAHGSKDGVYSADEFRLLFPGSEP